MQVEVVRTGWRDLNIGPGIPLMAVGTVLAAARVGALATIVICVSVVGGISAIGRTSIWISRRRARSGSKSGFLATATHDGEVGQFRSSGDQYVWSEKSCARTVQLEPSEISSVRLRRLPLVNATEASFNLSDGTTQVVTISAPVDEVAEAFASESPHEVS